MSQPIFLKLGGSLITDKTGVELVRVDLLSRLAREIAAALTQHPGMRLVLGHGSGSFGHVAGAEHGTRQGVYSVDEWLGFARVSDAASRLNRIVVKELLDAGVTAVTLQPSASALCRDGQIISLAHEPIRQALDANLVPVVFGDVAFDSVRNGTIISTEEVLMFVARKLQPSWFLLAGETAGVLDTAGQVVPLITAENYDQVAPAIGGSRGTDVTGGMAGKVRSMLDILEKNPTSRVRIFSGLEPQNLTEVLLSPDTRRGTELGPVPPRSLNW